MDGFGFKKAEKVTIKEDEYVSQGRNGKENFKTTTGDLKQIGESKITYVKPSDLNKKDVIEEKNVVGNNSSIKSITYKLTKPFGQKNEVTAHYYSNKSSINEAILGIEVIDNIIKIAIAWFNN